MKRYMIYLPLDVPGRLIRCGDDGSLTLSEMQTLVDGYIEVLGSSLEPTWAREPVDGIRLVVSEEGGSCAGQSTTTRPRGCTATGTMTRSWEMLSCVQRRTGS